METVKKQYIKSYGLLCFNVVNNELKVLLVKRKYTYDFYHYVMYANTLSRGSYIRMFSNMTIEEKRAIMTFNFDTMWNKLWNVEDSFNNIIYSRTKRNHEEHMERNKTAIINDMKNSGNAKERNCKLWSLPKGRRSNTTENKYFIAVREFNEETNISRSNYHIDFNFKRHFIMDNKYKIKYFIAYYRNNKRVKMDLTDVSLLNEVNGISWFSLEEILCECPELYAHVKPAFKYVRNNDTIL